MTAQSESFPNCGAEPTELLVTRFFDSKGVVSDTKTMSAFAQSELNTEGATKVIIRPRHIHSSRCRSN